MGKRGRSRILKFAEVGVGSRILKFAGVGPFWSENNAKESGVGVGGPFWAKGVGVGSWILKFAGVGVGSRILKFAGVGVGFGNSLESDFFHPTPQP